MKEATQSALSEYESMQQLMTLVCWLLHVGKHAYICALFALISLPAAMLCCSISITPSTLPAKMSSTLSASQHLLMTSLLSFCSSPAMRSGVL